MKLSRFALITVLLATASCRPFWLSTVKPAGTQEYQIGWEDGCDTGMSAESGVEMKMLFGFKKRPEMAANEQYKQGWNEGFSYCRFSYAASKNNEAFSDDLGWGN